MNGETPFQDETQLQREMFEEYNKRNRRFGLPLDFRGTQQTALQPATHRNDPVTSFKAEEKMNKGQRQTNAQKVYWLVCRYPGLTASDYTHLAPRHALFPSDWTEDKLLIEVRRRLSDMNGTLVMRGPRRKGRLNNEEVTWLLA